VSRNIIAREKRMYSVLPEFQGMKWAPAGTAPRGKSNGSIILKEFSGLQKAAIAITKAGRFGPSVVRGPSHFKK